MAIDSNAGKLMDLDAKIKADLEDEVAAMKEMYIELVNGLKNIRQSLSQTEFDKIGQKDAEEVLSNSKQAMASFNSELDQLTSLDARFAKIKKHAKEIKSMIENLKNTLNVYASSEKAVTDFDNNIIYLFKTKLGRDFEQDSDFNKRVEKALG